MTEPSETPRPRARRRARAGRRISVLGVSGEVLITLGVLVLLFIGWQQGLNNVVSANSQTSAAADLSSQWLAQADAGGDGAASPATGDKSGDTSADDAAKAGDRSSDATGSAHPPVMKQPGLYQPFAVLYIPRFGDDWKRVIREGVDTVHVLNSEHAGIGHYPDTQMPGQVGNFAIAGHVNGYGNAFIDMSKLRIGDAIYVQTAQGWYTYRFRDYEYVHPTAVSVLYPVPREKNTKPENRLITMTTCNPPFNGAERLAAYGVFDSWRPLSAGPPAAIAAEVKKGDS